MNKSRLLFVVSVCIIGLFHPVSNAATIVQVLSATSNTPTTGGRDINDMINQNGLGSGYISDVTDFDAYISTNPTHGNDQFTSATFGGATPVEITFDLGTQYIVESLALWNRGWADQGIENFSLYASDDQFFNTSTFLGNYTATAILGTPEETEAEIISFDPTTATYIRMDITSYYGSVGVSLNEVAFKATVVPIPAAIWLFCCGLLCLIGISRRYTDTR